MKFNACKTIFVPIEKNGRNYFPTVWDLKNKNIRAIDLVTGIIPLRGGEAMITSDAFLSLTENGQTYFIENVDAQRFDVEQHWGHRIEINKMLSFQDCYFDYTGTVSPQMVAIVCIWYDAPELANRNANGDIYVETQQIQLLRGDALQNRFRDVPYLHGAKYTDFAVMLGETNTPLGETLVSSNTRDHSYITLQRGTNIIFESVPLKLLYQNKLYYKPEMENMQIDFDNSYIQVAASVDVSADVNKFYNLQISYRKQ